MTEQEIGEALRDRSKIHDLMRSEGYLVFCKRFETQLTELTNKLLNPNTKAEEAEILRQLRFVLERDFRPETLLNNYLLKLDGIAKKVNPPTQA